MEKNTSKNAVENSGVFTIVNLITADLPHNWAALSADLFNQTLLIHCLIHCMVHIN